MPNFSLVAPRAIHVGGGTVATVAARARKPSACPDR